MQIKKKNNEEKSNKMKYKYHTVRSVEPIS